MNSNNMFDDFGTFQVLNKFGPWDALFITEILQQDKNKPHISFLYFLKPMELEKGVLLNARTILFELSEFEFRSFGL